MWLTDWTQNYFNSKFEHRKSRVKFSDRFELVFPVRPISCWQNSAYGDDDNHTCSHSMQACTFPPTKDRNGICLRFSENYFNLLGLFWKLRTCFSSSILKPLDSKTAFELLLEPPSIFRCHSFKIFAFSDVNTYGDDVPYTHILTGWKNARNEFICSKNAQIRALRYFHFLTQSQYVSHSVVCAKVILFQHKIHHINMLWIFGVCNQYFRLLSFKWTVERSKFKDNDFLLQFDHTV